MKQLVFDIGGQSVKHAIWEQGQLTDRGSFKTPSSWEELCLSMSEVLEVARSQHDLMGVGISAPGAVDSESGVIGGISAVPYIHNFNIIEAFQQQFGLTVAIENDANCAALAELAYGVGKGYDSVVFMIIGTGVGGAIAINGQLLKGKHLFAGELGYMLLQEERTLSNLASSRRQIADYNKLESGKPFLDGKDLFDRADAGEPDAQRLVDGIYDGLARGIFNTTMVLDPELVAIGGGISVRADIVDELTRRTKAYLTQQGAGAIEPNIQVCQFFNDANLIGAAVHLERQLKG